MFIILKALYPKFYVGKGLRSFNKIWLFACRKTVLWALK